MIFKAVLPAVVLAASASAALAQGFTGGELAIDVYAFSEGSDLTATTYSGALEYAINRNISIAGDLQAYDFSLSGSSNSFALHGIYHLNNETSVGAFVGGEELNGADTAMMGFEAGYESGEYEVEGYFAIYDSDTNANIMGLSGAYQINDSISVIADAGLGDLNGVKHNRVSLGAEYSFANGPNLYGQVGSISAGANDSTFIGLGANIQFGAERGTTFDRRGFAASVLPGF